MKKIPLLILIAAALLAVGACSKTDPAPAPSPEPSGQEEQQEEQKEEEPPVIPQAEEYDTALTNPKASQEAKKVYEFLLSTAGEKMLSGVQSGGTANNNETSEEIFKMTASCRYACFTFFSFAY